MEKTCTNLTDVVRSVRLLKIKGYGLTRDINSDHCFKSRWNADGYEWEIVSWEPNRIDDRCVKLHLIFLSEARAGVVRTTLHCCCLVDPR